jgi:alcohol dehydrogenase
MPELGVLRPPSTIIFADGSLAAAGRLAAAYGTRVTVCTDARLASTKSAGQLLGFLRASGLEVTVFDGAVVELPLPSVEEAIAVTARQRPDCLVAFGGGSCIDLAKLIALGLTAGQPLPEFYGEGRVEHPILPVVAIPTTSGTGSEVTPVAVLTDPSHELKVGISSERLVPRAAICDPTVTMGAPPEVTAHAGIDALAHAVEAFTAIERLDWSASDRRIFVGKNLLSDDFALRAVRCIADSLPAAMTDDPAARRRVAEASLCAGLAFASAGTSLAHALQYPIGARTHTPHGLGVGLLLPYCMQFNEQVRREEFALVGQALGVGPSAADAIDFVARLCKQIGLPGSLAELGIKLPDLPALAGQALGIERLINNNPRPVSRAALIDLLDAAWHGERSRIPLTTT